ncbi:single-stranded DNA-binding protein, mitochondrial [Cryptomeria japonica]|uniref:single-stranded DNA-binding protein, mitochondrial n=1 Tax=Cryptomeria japonica TaxID=3369 RepID=UPI0025AC0439|nr:single-stranded DNA-binding protein, mitochondrial [Cryptomeria japonica]
MAPRLANLVHPLNRILGMTDLKSGLLGAQKLGYSTITHDSSEEKEIKDARGNDEIDTEQRELQPQGVDPRKGWGFRGVHKAIICGKVGQTPVQKILRNGRTVTIFTVGTDGMFDQRTIGMDRASKPLQWHRIAVHNEQLGAYVVQQLIKNACVYVEGDIEMRVYNDNINGQVRNVPEICIRRNGIIRLINGSEPVKEFSFEGLGENLF